jgi:hypothetical protein
MRLEKWAHVAELIGGVAIVLSLVFVGVQIREGNRETRAATIQAALRSEMDMATTFLEYAETWDKVLNGESLAAGREFREGNLLYQVLMLDTEIRFYQYQSGYLDEAAWRARESTLPRFVALPIYEFWLTTPGGQNHSQEFLGLLEAMESQSNIE